MRKIALIATVLILLQISLVALVLVINLASRWDLRRQIRLAGQL